MPAFPDYAHIQFRDTGEQPSPVVIRSEMDRGPAKQRRTAADANVQVPVVVLFRSDADAESFEDWFYSASGANGGATWFDWVNPRSGATVLAQIVDGDIGRLNPLNNAWARSERPMVLEYMRSAI